MSHYKFYRFFTDGIIKMLVKDGALHKFSLRKGKPNYKKVFEYMLLKELQDAKREGRPVYKSSTYFVTMLERQALLDGTLSTIIVKDMDTVNRIMDFKVTVNDMSKLLVDGETVQIVVPIESSIRQTLVGRVPRGYMTEACVHSHIFFGSNHEDYQGWESQSDVCSRGKNEAFEKLSPSHQFAIKVLMYRNATRVGFTESLPNTGSGITSMRHSSKVEKLELTTLKAPEGIALNEHYRKDHFRQLWADRYYRGEWESMERGFRVAHMPACIVRRKSTNIVTLEK